MLILASATGGVILTLLAEIDGKVSPLSEVLTVPLIVDTTRVAKLAFTWVNGAITAAACNSHFVYHPDEPDAVVDHVVLQPSTHPLIDLSEKNEAALSRRAGRLESWRIAGGDPKVAAYVYAALQDEVGQLRDLLALIKRGAEHHVPGVAARVRLLVTGSPMGLLQFAAALKAYPLVLYTTSEPFREVDQKALYGLNLSGSPTPRGSDINPVDLDVWLRTPALVIHGKDLSVSNLITQIGNTVGAHLDLDVLDLVAAMTRRPSLTGSRYNDIGAFMSRLAVVLVALGEQVLAAPEHQGKIV